MGGSAGGVRDVELGVARAAQDHGDAAAVGGECGPVVDPTVGCEGAALVRVEVYLVNIGKAGPGVSCEEDSRSVGGPAGTEGRGLVGGDAAKALEEEIAFVDFLFSGVFADDGNASGEEAR